MKLADLIARYYFVEHTMNVLSFAFGGLVIYVLIKHSPSSFGRFKWLMINVTASEIVYMVFGYYVYQPVPLFPSYSGICLGPVSRWGSDSCYLSTLIFMLMLAYSVVSLTICFVYRYSLVAPEWIGRRLSKNKILIPTFLFMLSTSAVPIMALWIPRDSASNVRAQLFESRPEWRTEIDNYVYFGPRSDIFVYIFMMSLIFLLVCNTLISLVFTYLIHHELRKHKRIMSSATFQMHRTLINILLAQTLIPLTFILIPITFVVYLTVTKTVNDSLMHISHAPLAMYPFINSCLFLRFSPPHRRALVNLFWLVVTCGSEQKIVNLKQVTMSRVSMSRI